MNQFNQLLNDRIAHLGMLSSTAEALADGLRHETAVVSLQRALEDGSTDAEVAVLFCRRLLSEFTPGRRFYGDPVLASVAIVLERDFSALADEFLKSLSEMRLAEIPMSSRIARLVIARRQIYGTPTVRKTFVIPFLPTFSVQDDFQYEEPDYLQLAA